MKTLTKPQMIVMETLYDVATHEGGGIILKNRYHSPAHALEQKGYVRKQDRFPYRPHYFITNEGRAFWESLLTMRAADGGNGAAQPKAECEDCRLPYESFMLDVTLPDEQWLAIHPSGKDGLLCARCIVARASKLSNIVAVRATLELG